MNNLQYTQKYGTKPYRENEGSCNWLQLKFWQMWSATEISFQWSALVVWVDIQVSGGLGQFRKFGGVANANRNLRQEEHTMTALLPNSLPHFSFCVDAFIFFCTSAFTCVYFAFFKRISNQVHSDFHYRVHIDIHSFTKQVFHQSNFFFFLLTQQKIYLCVQYVYLYRLQAGGAIWWGTRGTCHPHFSGRGI